MSVTGVNKMRNMYARGAAAHVVGIEDEVGKQD